MSKALAEEYKLAALREMDIAIMWRRRMKQAEQKFHEAMEEAARFNDLSASMLQERSATVLQFARSGSKGG